MGNHYLKVFIITLSVVVVTGVAGLYIAGRVSGRFGDTKGRSGVTKVSTGKVTDSDGSPIGRKTESLDDIVDTVQSADTGDADDTDAEAAAADDGADTEAYSYKYSGVCERFGDDLDDPAYLESNRIYIRDSRDSDADAVTLTFAGDILFDDEYAVYSRLLGNGGQISAGIDPSLINIMSGSDITMVNNEFPYSYGGSPTEGKTYTFRADPSTVHLLDDMGVNVVGIANNHAYDFGQQAFLDTLDTLAGDGMPYTGGGHDISEASAPVYFVIDDVKIGIIAATQIERLDNPDTKGATDSSPGVFRCMNPDRLLSTVTEMKSKCDLTVVFIHWGTESTAETDWLQQDQAPKIAAAGADLIIGAHPHVLQPIGTSGGIPVVYSLGNFWFNSKELDTGLVQASVTADGLQSLRFIPCRQVGCRTTPAVGGEYDRILQDMRAMSPGVSIDADGYITY